MAVVVCQHPDYLLRRVAYCPNCRTKRRFSGRASVWYDTTWTCCGCGDAYTGGERHEHPFRPRWRPQAMAAARADWDNAQPYSVADYTRWCHEQLGIGDDIQDIDLAEVTE